MKNTFLIEVQLFKKITFIDMSACFLYHFFFFFCLVKYVTKYITKTTSAEKLSYTAFFVLLDIQKKKEIINFTYNSCLRKDMVAGRSHFLNLKSAERFYCFS